MQSLRFGVGANMDSVSSDGDQTFECSDGGRLRYAVAGSGEPVVFLHGFGLDLDMWDPQWQVFAKAYRVVRYDLRGYGGSSLPAGRYSHVDDFVALSGFLRAHPAHLIGLSLGGRLALRIAAQVPAAVRSLTLVDAALDGHDWSADWSQRWRAMIAAAQTDLPHAKQLWLEHDLFVPARANPSARKALDAMVRRYSGWHFKNDDPGTGPIQPFADSLARIVAPTMVIVGSLDLPDFQAIALTLKAEMPHASLRVMPNVGHMPNLENARDFNQLVLTHIASCRA